MTTFQRVIPQRVLRGHMGCQSLVTTRALLVTENQVASREESEEKALTATGEDVLALDRQ
jgi:hypothetical protein